jgi:hypothetical protein
MGLRCWISLRLADEFVYEKAASVILNVVKDLLVNHALSTNCIP